MAKIIGQVESLKSLKAELINRNVKRFSSVGDINRFIKDFPKEKQNILKYHEDSLIKELKQKNDRIFENEKKVEVVKDFESFKLNARIEKYIKSKSVLENKRGFFIIEVIAFIRKKILKRKIAYLQDNFDRIINKYFRKIKKEIDQDTNNVRYLSENKQKVILERSSPEIDKIEHEKKTVDELRTIIAGAVGESLVEKEIRKLSDDFTLINDYRLNFKPPIFNKKTKDRIFSIQLDHLLVSQSGIFILETKNWSKKSIQSLDLRSPVDQIIRTSYAMFIVANNNISLNKHHWGKKQIPIRSVIVMINEKPKFDFKYVKIKQLKELNRYIEYFEPIFSRDEVESIANSLIRIRN